MNTHLTKPAFTPMPLVWKILSLVLIAAFLVIGVAGLILPVIPGVLFLFLAALLATRVSRRAARFAHQQPWFHHHLRQWQASGHLSIGERVKLAALITIRTCVRGLQSLWRLAARARR